MTLSFRSFYLLALLLILNGVAWPAWCQSRFTLAIIPDTQQETGNNQRDDFANRMQWLVANQQKLNLQMVMQVGDLTNWDTPDHDHYVRASQGLELLDKAGIAYALTLGNHDTAAVKVGGSAAPGDVKANLRITTTFNSYFPTQRFKYLAQTFEEGKIDNAIHTFTAGGLDWMVLNLELWPRNEAIDWAKTVVAAHPHHNVILLTHSYLEGSGEIKQNNGGYGTNSPQYLYDQLVSQYPNIKLVFSGHVGQNAHRTDTGKAGNTIYSFLQCFHDKLTNPVRLLTIDTTAGSMQSNIYCPMTDETKPNGTFTLSDVKWVMQQTK